ncbi:MAG: helix-turn-helix domain-containing protein [Candidatus Omnitrophica bacterium]|nr:helix-turn-helix domain-containing protein [Candidatus Omnitrophota bacterium]
MIRRIYGPAEGENQQNSRPEMMTLKDVARYCGVHEVTIYRLLKETDIPAVKLRGQWRFRKDLLDAWLEEGMNRHRVA